ncbi:MAG: alpha/beta hydrolase [Pseudoruegeria sp.]
MSQTEFFETPQGRRIAYYKINGQGPGIVFLGGFKSDMEGSKAQHLQNWAIAHGRSFLRFDYSGHGQSSGVFEEGCIGDWAEDAKAAIEVLTDGPQVLVGSSMGGWISLLMSQRTTKVAGMVTIAAAPDFTEDGYWAAFNESQRAQVMEEGQFAVPSDYGDPYIITRRLIEDGREQLVLRSPLSLPFPVRCLQGTADAAVSTETALRLLEHATCDDIRLTLVKGEDHSFSTPGCLVLIEKTIEKVLNRIDGA